MKVFILPPLMLLLLLLLPPPEVPQSSGSHHQVAVAAAAMEVEELMSSEESGGRRQLLVWGGRETKYISYGALRGDVVPCGKAGVPYYNCYALPSAGPYSRGCETITACRGG